MRFRIGALLALPILLTANAEPILVPDVSQRKVEIAYSFTGAELLLFGAILYPGGRQPKRDADIAVVLRGPSAPVRVWEKDRLLGLIWANSDSARFQSAPGYYAIASSRPVRDVVDERTAAIYELGLGNIQISPSDAITTEKLTRFESGMVALRKKTRLFDETTNSVEITDGVLYRAKIAIPARVPTGNYTAETFLIRDRKVIAAATRDITIVKSGFERFVAQSAEDHPALYGLFAVALSLAMGWGASVATQRFR
jgi:uncharacterized protein (TIGR02186 family)